MLQDVVGLEVFASTNDFFAAYRSDGVLNIDVRGTDGTSPVKWVSAWLRNASWTPNEKGEHQGFRDSVDVIMQRMEDVMEEYSGDTVVLRGHSAGGAIVQILGMDIVEDYEKKCIVYALGAPPPGTRIVRDRYYRQHNSGSLEIMRIVNPRDMVTVICRDIRYGGCDCGHQFELPPDSIFQMFFKQLSGAVEHSPREYCDGLIEHFKNLENSDEVKLLKRIRKLLVN
jgi:hypothetical protein